jgi:hypothetical protein
MLFQSASERLDVVSERAAKEVFQERGKDVGSAESGRMGGGTSGGWS